MAAKSRRRKRKGSGSWSFWTKLAIMVCSILLIVIATGMVIVASKMTKIEITKLDTDKLNIAKAEEETETGYLNVALFGLDSRENDLGRGNRSDTMMIASLNKETKEVKLVSIYRDTLLQLDDGTYNKANAAYSFGGPEGAISLINRNLDMNIEKYVTVNFNALVDVIDALGGVDIAMAAPEVVHMNNYCVETSEVTGKSYTKIEPEVDGTYHLNGVQAVSYSRIRYTEGGDFKRASRQQLVLSLIAEKAQSMSLSSINKIIDSVFPQVSTNFTLSEMVSYAKDIKKYKLGESMGFPANNTFGMLDGPGSVVLADTLCSNVLDVHGFLFGSDGYKVSSNIEKIEDEIAYKMSGSSGSDSYDDSTWDDDSWNDDADYGYSNSGSSGSSNSYDYDDDDDWNGGTGNSGSDYDDTGGGGYYDDGTGGTDYDDGYGESSQSYE